uniref:Uncharacterized protein n=1 Tax=Vitis vinifera TaxID=29760 RepID=A5ANT5_VITVI|nr:hypothetical protein VITISV_029018 [Vitis vinifera]
MDEYLDGTDKEGLLCSSSENNASFDMDVVKIPQGNRLRFTQPPLWAREWLYKDWFLVQVALAPRVFKRNIAANTRINWIQLIVSMLMVKNSYADPEEYSDEDYSSFQRPKISPEINPNQRMHTDRDQGRKINEWQCALGNWFVKQCLLSCELFIKISMAASFMLKNPHSVTALCELMDPREIRTWKADYARVRISQEQLKFAGTLHPSPDITKALNSRESRKVPKESRMYTRIQHQQRSQSRLQASPIQMPPWCPPSPPDPLMALCLHSGGFLEALLSKVIQLCRLRVRLKKL